MVDHLMVQQQIRAPHKKWKHMVGVMCLNLTYRKHVKIILPKLFARYPNPQAYLRGRLKTQQEMLKPLGMWEVRSKRIRKMTEQYTNMMSQKYFGMMTINMRIFYPIITTTQVTVNGC